MNQTARMHTALKRALRSAGLTYADVAVHLELSEASVKRLFARESLSVQRLERIADMAGVSFADLVEQIDADREFLTRLTLEQERELVADNRLLLLAYLLLNGAEPFDICQLYSVTPDEAQRLLVRLDRLRIIELGPSNRVRLLTARNFSWRADGPVRRLFRDQIQDEFLDGSFDGTAEVLRFVSGSLSTGARDNLCRTIDRVAREFEEAVRHDSSQPQEERHGCSAVLAIRPWEPTIFARLRRPGK